MHVSSTELGRQLTEEASVEIAAELKALSATLTVADRRILARLINQLVMGSDPAGGAGASALSRRG